jgi:hypothetical protein
MAEKRGLFSRLRQAWADWRDGGPRPRENEDFEPPNGSEVLLQVVPYFRWSSSAMSFETLSARALQYVEPARGRLLREVWTTARRFGPTQLQQAEQAINDLDNVRKGWCYQDKEGEIRCSPTVRVLLDPRLRDQLLPFEMRLCELEKGFDLGDAKAQRVRRLTEQWLQIIRELEAAGALGNVERQFLVPFAASMSDNDFATVMHALAQTRSERATDLVAVLQQASKNHEGVGLFEFAKAFDMAAQSYSRQLGLGPHRWNLKDMNPTEAP